jgi:predicted nucleotide-binding protein
MPERKHLFVSYAHGDLDRVFPVVEAIRRELELRQAPVGVWIDVTDLRPGDSWSSAIFEALQASIGFLFFASPRSLKSEWVRRQLQIATYAAGHAGSLIIPIVLTRDLEMPPALGTRQWIDLSGPRTQQQILAAARQVADAVEAYERATPTAGAPVASELAAAIATDLANELRAPETTDSGESGSSVFVVHGHADEALVELERFLSSIGIEPVILSRRGEAAQSLFQKFMLVGSRAKFAVVLLSSDDYGASRRQYDAEGVADRALQFRARQNVVLELGFFYGRLGWENVFVVYEAPNRIFPNFERPSDLDGVVFDSMSDVAWRANLRARLARGGFAINEPT